MSSTAPLELHPPPSPSALAPAHPPAAPNPRRPGAHTQRLSLPFALRLSALTISSMAIGGTLGSFLGGHRASLIFRAENAHRAPTTTSGWYFYHKTKNYRIMRGAVFEGLRTGARVSAWVAMFVVFEDAVDRLRGRVDALGTVVAGLGTGGVFSVWHGLSYGLTVRAAKKGLVLGLAFGIAQDAIRCAKGHGGGVFEYIGFGAGRREAREANEAAVAGRVV